MGFYSKTSDAIQQAHGELAHEFTVYNYIWDESSAASEYADGQWTESSTTVDATIRSTKLAEASSDASGVDIQSDVEIYVPSDTVVLRFGEADEERATEFVDSRTGQRYQAFDYAHEGALVRVYCTEV
jgi:hypothetical protein